jgi:DNA-binding LytR/AlgR family response regulator
MKKTPSTKPKILMVEDDMIIAADISIQLSKLDYEVIGISAHAEDALNVVATNRPDIILMDIVLSGDMNGIEAALLILERHEIPVIFLTSNTDDTTFNQALAAKPFAFIAKPFQSFDLERTLKMALQRITLAQGSESLSTLKHPFSVMEDRIFIRENGQLVKIRFTEILFAEADRSYCKLYTQEKIHVLSVPLRTLESQLPEDKFVRTHRSFVINLEKIDAISENYEFVTVNAKQIPISRRMKEQVVKRIKMI